MNREYLPWGQLSGETQFPMQFSRKQPFKEQLAKAKPGSIPYGRGRSYGDSCLGSLSIPIVLSEYNHFIEFDEVPGVLQCEGATLLSELLEVVIPKGWFISVTPGTQIITLAGAVANDIHGKNHHKADTLDCHILNFSLARSTGEVILCSTKENEFLFCATIGGLGLTGIIMDVTIQFKRIINLNIVSESIKFSSISEYSEIAEDSVENCEYTVSWIDYTAQIKY